MVQSDALSRRPDHCPEDDHDNGDMVLLERDLFVNLLDLDLQEQITRNGKMDFNATEAMEALLDNGPTSLRNDLEDWKLETTDQGKVLFYKGKNYIPKDDDLRRDIVKKYHDLETAGHPGELETYNSVNNSTGGPDLEVS